MSGDNSRKRTLSEPDNKNRSSKRRSICEEIENVKIDAHEMDSSENEVGGKTEPPKNEHEVTDTKMDKNSHKSMASVSDSVFSDASVMRSVSECDQEDDSDDPFNEYETQLFGFTPKSFMNGVYNALAEYIRESLAALTEYIKQQYPDEMTASELQASEENIMKYVLRKLNRSFDILENYLMTNVFSIPDHVVLPEDQIQTETQYTEEDEKQINIEIQQLKEKILAIRYANGVLRQDLLKISEAQGMIDSSLKQMESIEDITKECGVSDKRDDTIFAVNQVKKLINIVQSLETEK